jgi:AcrR family transcriptional regulator
MAGSRTMPSQPVRRGPRVARVRAENNAGNGLGHAHIAQIQRARLLAAMFDVATERGGASVTVADVVERSGVSRRTFYETFADREECFIAAFDDALAFASQRVIPAYTAETKWREQLRAGLLALLSFFDEEPLVARLLVVESLSAGAKTLERRDELLIKLAAIVDGGRSQSSSAASLSSLTAEGLVGGALALIHSRLARSKREPLLALTNGLMSMIVLPYLGSTAARRELERPIQPCAKDHRDTRMLTDPLKGAGMRLTYRTVRVLMAVADHPNASNRTIGEQAGIKDQGQISKLLGRLARLGLIQNTGIGPGQGGPNAWNLTHEGHHMTKNIRTHTDPQPRGK